jgi:hypothetical protein
MTFQKQTRWCWTWSAALTVLLLIFFAAAEIVPHRLAHMFEILTWLIAFELVLILFVGGIFRPLTRKIYLMGLAPMSPFRAIAGTFLLRHWLWVTPQGRDRDA